MQDTIDICCSMCKEREFTLKKALMNRRASTFFKLDFFDYYMYAYFCAKCGHIEWFDKDILNLESDPYRKS